MPDAHGKLTEIELKDRWKTPVGKQFKDKILLDLQRTKDYKVDWKNLNVMIDNQINNWIDFTGVHELSEPVKKVYKEKDILWHTPIMEAVFIQRKNYHGIKYLNIDNKNYGDLRGIDFNGYLLDKAQLDLANFEYANLTNASFKNANFEKVNLKNTDISGSNFNNCNLSSANLENSYLDDANFEGANFSGANLKGVSFYNTILINSNFSNTRFNLKSWWYRVVKLVEESKISDFLDNFFIPLTLCFSAYIIKKQYLLVLWFPIYFVWHFKNEIFLKPTNFNGADVRNVKLDSDPVLYKELLDEQYLDKFSKKHKILYSFWLLRSNCGRSLSLVLIWSFILAVIFGFVFIPLDFQHSGTTQWWHSFYLSFVTITTLGLSSVEPISFWAAFWHTVENIIGYLWLGYAISVLGSKLTRRSA